MRCIWCGKKLSDEEIQKGILFEGTFDRRNCCSKECKTKTENFNKYAKKNVKYFLILFLLGIIGMITINIIYMAHKVPTLPYGSFAWAGIIFGGTLIKFPFCTPQTNSGLGIKKSVMIARVLGIIFLVLGLFSLIKMFI